MNATVSLYAYANLIPRSDGQILLEFAELTHSSLSPAPIGDAWIDYIDASVQPIVQKIPLLSLYHMAMTFKEFYII